MHAIVAFFDTEFSKCHTRTIIDTSPKEPYTHWKQTVFYVEDELPVDKGDFFNGTISARRHEKNPREYNIKFS